VDSFDDVFESNETNNISAGVPEIFTLLAPDSVTLQIGSTVLRAGQSGVVPVSQSAGSGATGLTFTVGYPADRLNGALVTNVASNISAAILSQSTMP